MTIEVGKVSTEAAPEGFLRRLNDSGTCRLGTADNGNDLIPAASIMGKGDAAETAACDRGLQSNVFCNFFKWVERNPRSWGLDEGDALGGCIGRCVQYGFIELGGLAQVGDAER
jgi:hypothetical protein